MKTVRLSVLGRFGNQLFRYAHARALCEQNGYALKTEPWVGEKIFTLDGPENASFYRPTGNEDIVIDGYHQAQSSLIYTRRDCRRWFKLKPEVERVARQFKIADFPVAHYRRGDYVGSSYPLISRNAVMRAAHQFGINDRIVRISDDCPAHSPMFPDELSFLPDFLALMQADVLFRANSSFSYWAAVLGHGKVFSPIITGLAGGVEHDDVKFVEGNHARLAELPFITELHLPE